MANINLGNIIDAGAVVKTVLEKAADDPKQSLARHDVSAVAAVVTAAVKAQVAEAQADVNAQIKHLTNNEPAIKSRVTIGNVVTILTVLLSVIGVGTEILPPDKLTVLVTAGFIVGGALFSLYGRWVAKKPLGE